MLAKGIGACRDRDTPDIPALRASGIAVAEGDGMERQHNAVLPREARFPHCPDEAAPCCLGEDHGIRDGALTA